MVLPSSPVKIWEIGQEALGFISRFFFYFLMVCLARIGCVHRLNPSWEFLDYRLDLRVYHGTMLIREAHSSTFQVLGSTGAHIFNGFTVSWFWQQIADLTWSLPFFKAQLILSKIYNLQILHGHLLPLIFFWDQLIIFSETGA